MKAKKKGRGTANKVPAKPATQHAPMDPRARPSEVGMPGKKSEKRYAKMKGVRI